MNLTEAKAYLFELARARNVCEIRLNKMIFELSKLDADITAEDVKSLLLSCYGPEGIRR